MEILALWARSEFKGYTVELGLEWLVGMTTVRNRSQADEQIQEVVPDNMALPISYCLGTKVPVQGTKRRDSPRSREPCQGIFPPDEM